MSPSTDQRENREFAHEIKFIVPRSLAAQVRDWARTHLAPDPNAAGDFRDTYHITSLYFDTDRFDVFHRRGSFGRSKFRIRQYGSSETVFLERKLKTRGLLTKRRSLVKLDELGKLTDGEAARDWPGRWFYRRLRARKLKLVCQIGYHRTARVCMTELGPIRLTLDDDIRAIPTDSLCFNADAEGISLSKEHIVLELKYRMELPLLFKGLIEQFALAPQPISKYRLAVAALGLVPNRELNPPAGDPIESSLCLSS